MLGKSLFRGSLQPVARCSRFFSNPAAKAKSIDNTSVRVLKSDDNSYFTTAEFKAKLAACTTPYDYWTTVQQQFKNPKHDKRAPVDKNISLNLLKLCKVSKDIPFARAAIKFHQGRRLDFNELITNEYIRLLEDCGTPQFAVQTIVRPEHRFGAWVTTAGNEKLINLLMKQNHISDIVNIQSVFLHKGVPCFTNETIHKLMEIGSNAEDPNHYNHVLLVVEKIISNSRTLSADMKFTELREQYPWKHKKVASEGSAVSEEKVNEEPAAEESK